MRAPPCPALPRRAAALALTAGLGCVVGCAAPDADDKGARGSVAAAGGSSLRVVALVDGEPAAAPVALFPSEIMAFDPDHPGLQAGPAGETLGVGPGRLRVFVGDEADPAGLSEGLPLWTDPAGTTWISPSVLMEIHEDTHHEVTFTLNQRALGAWRCEGGGMQARAEALAYAAGSQTSLPGPGPVRVEGRAIRLDDALHTIEGRFTDAEHATLEEQIPGRADRSWACCAEAACADPDGEEASDSATPAAG